MTGRRDEEDGRRRRRRRKENLPVMYHRCAFFQVWTNDSFLSALPLLGFLSFKQQTVALDSVQQNFKV